ncbi:MAG TPA: hypothetical protein VEH31_20090 [Streptosporangiaceae bacterium]|nr:hypothetical protein [Streptosporangiaceae bacterium]
MNPIQSSHRLSITLAGLAAAALALPACGTPTAASHTPHHATPAIMQQAQNGLTFADLQDVAKAKRDLFQRLAERSPRR